MEKGKGVGEGEKGNEGGEEKWESRRGKGEAYLKEKGTRLDISIGVIRPPNEKSHFLWRRRKSDRFIHFT